MWLQEALLLMVLVVIMLLMLKDADGNSQSQLLSLSLALLTDNVHVNPFLMGGMSCLSPSSQPMQWTSRVVCPESCARTALLVLFPD